MTSKSLPALAFLGLLIGLVIGMVLVFGERIQPRDVWGSEDTPSTLPATTWPTYVPMTGATAVMTEIGG